MLKFHRGLFPALALGGTCLLPLDASALYNITLPSPGGKLMIGREYDGPIVSAYFRSSSGQCEVWTLGTNGGLSDDYIVWGTTGADDMRSVTYAQNLCGVQLTPINFNGRTLGFKGGRGNDTLGGRVTWAAGDEDDDILYAQAYVTTDLWGYTGNDKLRGASGTRVWGEAGNDLLCFIALQGVPRPTLFDGGFAEFDVACGTADQMSSIESQPPNCAWQCP